MDYKEKEVLVLSPSNHINNQIQKLLGKHDNRVTFMTYSLLSKVLKDGSSKIKADLIIIDEFHRAGAKTWEKAILKLLENNKESKVLGTSATPIRYLDNKRDMGDEIFEENVIVNISLVEAIARQILPAPRYISALYTIDEEVEKLQKRINSYIFDKEEKEKSLKELYSLKNSLEKSRGVPNILKKYITFNSESMKFIVFCKNAKHMKIMKEKVNNWFKEAFPDKYITSRTLYSQYANNEIGFLWIRYSPKNR